VHGIASMNDMKKVGRVGPKAIVYFEVVTTLALIVGLIVLAATLSSVGAIPVASIALILGIDRFMSEARALTNLVGNRVATVVVTKWENALDIARLQRHLAGAGNAEADTPERALA
jgi:aerobic C4-dicarboxylate transport protein